MNPDSLSQFLFALARISAQAGVLVLLVLALRWLLGDRLTPRWRCALWLLVAARLLLPASFASAVSLFNLLPHWQRPVLVVPVTPPPVAATATDSALRTPESALDPSSSRRESALIERQKGEVRMQKLERSRVGEAEVEGQKGLPEPEATEATLLVGQVARQNFPTAAILFAGWLLGVCALGGWLVHSSWQTHRRFCRLNESRAAVPAVPGRGRRDACPTLESLLDACRAQLGLRTRLTVVECDGLSSPALYGLFRPRLLLPRGFADKFSPEELRFVFLHELAHLKRRDLLVNWLAALLQIAHWFNPLLWLGFACWRADRELACDALVLETAGADRSQDYGRTILRLLEGFTHRAAAPGLVGILEDKRRLRQRIAMIARFVPTRRWSPLAILLVLALAVVGLTDAQGPKAGGGNEAESAAESAVVEWGEPVNGLVMRALPLAGTNYRAGGSLPIKVQLKNVSSDPFPCEQLGRTSEWVATDTSGNWLPLKPCASVGIWKGRKEPLASGELIEWTDYVETIRFRESPVIPKDALLSFRVVVGADSLGRGKYLSSNPVKVRFESAPFDDLMAGDLPDRWQPSLAFAYTDGRGIWGGSRYLQIAPDGAARLILGSLGRPANQLLPGVAGTFSARLSTAQLDRLIGLMRTNRVWELARIPTAEVPARDYPTIAFNVAYRGKSLAMHNGDPAQPQLKAFRDAMDRFLVEVVETARKSGSAQTASGPLTSESDLPRTNALHSRIVFERTVFKQGEPIEAKVLVKNVSDQPVRYDARTGESNWLLLDPDGRPVPSIFMIYSSTIVGYSQGPWRPGRPGEIEAYEYPRLTNAYDYPLIEPGQEVAVVVLRIDPNRFYIGKPGAYRFAWRGTAVLPMDSDGSKESYAGQRRISQMRLARFDESLKTNALVYEKASNLRRQREHEVADFDRYEKRIRPMIEAQKLAVGLPPAEPVVIEVVRTPGTYGDVLGRILEPLPPGWKIEGSKLDSNAIAPLGWQPERGSSLHLIRAGRPPGHLPWIALFVMAERLVENPAAKAGVTERAQYLGKGPFGHVYVALGRDEVNPGTGREDRNPLTCWSHAAYDIAVALEVTEPTVKKSVGPDWGRMVSSILNGVVEGQPPGPFGAFCANAELSTGENGRPLIRYEWNTNSPRYKVVLTIQPIGSPSQFIATEAEKSIRWDGAASVRGYQIKRLGVDIVIEVRSDEPEFVKQLNAILDREISAVLGGATDSGR